MVTDHFDTLVQSQAEREFHMLYRVLSRFGINAPTVYAASFLSVVLSIATWFLRGGEDRAAGERLAIFVGLWAPTLMTLGTALERAEEHSARNA